MIGFREKITRITSLAGLVWDEERIEDLYEVTQMNNGVTDVR